MQENQPHPTPGFISRSVMALALIIRIFQGIGLASSLDKLAIALVSLYQRYLSPYKGFRCAHKTLYGGTSCSQYFQTVVREKGLVAAIPKFQQRLLDCKQANVLIHAQDNSEEKTKKKKRIGSSTATAATFLLAAIAAVRGNFAIRQIADLTLVIAICQIAIAIYQTVVVDNTKSALQNR
ncbi:membrane protein insertion efficiency factor YidD [Geitlerinema sp. PCC 9228]|jgi:putative component of membrane protein insertase Oxa1/YidC/SpoIIIJ protein YidD|uniref:membrane protein insertion efficiency factor YidD n=1 Tax=Geitlerinema sp. PCC 9228 TaxID=111611 RepID=UPI0008F9B55F|nr:membrane protein insertion efficiency factor YidD [Geitlerinema sp. PCC 9228]